MPKKRLAIIIAFGPEVRSFIFSGLIERLAQKYRITIFTPKPDSAAFQGIPDSVELIALPQESDHPLLSRWRYRTALLHALWLEKSGAKKWQHYLTGSKGIRRNQVKDFFLSVVASQWLARFLAVMELKLAKELGTNAIWAKHYAELGIDAVMASSFASERSLPALQTALNLGLATIIIPNSWKDIYTKPHLPFRPSRLLVWSAANADRHLKFNPWLNPKTLVVTGSLHLEAFLNARLLHREDFCAINGLDPGRPYICYTAAAPNAVKNEENIVAGLLAAIRCGGIFPAPQVLLRLNPMEDGSRFADLAGRYPQDLIVQQPKWEWLPAEDWCCSRPEDLEMWSSTVHYAFLNVSIPSTVTLEFAVRLRPVVNVCFDLPAISPEQSNRRFWGAEFYAEIRDNRLAIPAFSLEEMVKVIQKLVSDRGAYDRQVESLRRGLDRCPEDAVGKIEAVVSELVQA